MQFGGLECVILKNCAIPASFSLFSSFRQLTVNFAYLGNTKLLSSTLSVGP